MGRALLDSTSYLLVSVAKAHRRLVAEGLDELGLHTGQELVLAQLWREDGLRSSDLAERLGVTPPTTTQVVSGMERAGLLRREADPLDARASRVWLTDHGRELREPVERLWRALEHRTLRGLDAVERGRLERAFAQMLGNVS